MASGTVANRPRTVGFFVIEGGGIKYLKLSNVSVGMTQPIARDNLTSAIQNPAWTISTGGSSNIHVHDNTILAISNNEVWMFAGLPQRIGLKVFGFRAELANEHVSRLFS